jgi:hypothetical protein
MDFLLVLNRSRGTFDTVRVPARHRRGASRDSLARHFGPKFRFDHAVNSISLLEGAWRLGDGQLLLVHYDSEARMEGKRLAGLGGRAFATILSPDLRMACLDGVVPTARDARPFFAVQGDTLLVLEQLVPDGQGAGVRTVVKRYGVSANACDWIPIR